MVGRMNKKAGFEMSTSTMVIIIIAVVLLVLGLVFVRQIFSTATSSVSAMDEKVKEQLKSMFGNEDQGSIVVYNKVTSIKAGSEGFRIPIGASTRTGETVQVEQLMFSVQAIGGDCDKTEAESWFVYPTPKVWSNFDDFEANIGLVDVTVTIPKGIARCSSIMSIKLKDKNSAGQAFASSTFTIKVV